MRSSCLECVAKHLGAASVYMEETAMGYPNYFGYVYGELDHAATECMREYPDFSWAIREHRIRWATTRKNKSVHNIPFEAMFGYIDACNEAGVALAVPEEVYEGLILDEDGRLIVSMDTRP